MKFSGYSGSLAHQEWHSRKWRHLCPDSSWLFWVEYLATWVYDVMLQLVSFQSAKCCATKFDLRSKSIQRNVQAIQQFPMTFSLDWFCVWNIEAGSSYPCNTVGKKLVKSATLFGRLDAWKTTPSLHVLQHCPSTRLWRWEKQWSISLNMTWLAWKYIYIYECKY